MTNHVEVSPGGIGFVRTTATKSIPGDASQGARRRAWVTGRFEAKNSPSTTVVKSSVGKTVAKSPVGKLKSK